jgi:hypothetical protein
MDEHWVTAHCGAGFPRGSCPQGVDAVEKVRVQSPSRNNRIRRAQPANQCCVEDADFESILLGQTPKFPFSTVIEQNISGLPSKADISEAH